MTDIHNISDWAIDRPCRTGAADRPAIRFIAKDDGVTVMTYGDLRRETMRFATVLRRLGVVPGERVAILAGRVPAAYVAALGSLRARSVVCPLFSAFGPEPTRQRLVLGEVSALVTTAAQYRRKIEPQRAEIPSLRHVLMIDGADDLDGTDGVWSLSRLMREVDDVDAPCGTDPVPTSPDDPALVHFTSGTTGTPKGALHVHDAVRSHHDTAFEVFGLRPGDVYWCTADPGWVTGTSYGMIAPLTCGVTMVVDEAEFEAARWYRNVAEHRVTVWYTAPTAIRMLMKSGDDLVRRFDLTSLRVLASVGEPLDAEAVIWGRDVIGCIISDTWWQTETGSIMIASTPAVGIRPGSMGRPVTGVTAGLLVADDDGRVVVDGDGHVLEVDAPDAPGVIALRPGWPSMFRGYLGAEERYRSSFVYGWYVAGDLARRDADGYYWFIGRADDVIKTAGHLIGPFEVEQVLMQHPDVAQAGVYGVPDDVAGTVIHACVVLADGEGSEEQISRIMAHARRRLGAAVAPRRIEVVESLPITRSGKVMRRLLRARELGLPEGDVSTLESTSEEESKR